MSQRYNSRNFVEARPRTEARGQVGSTSRSSSDVDRSRWEQRCTADPPSMYTITMPIVTSNPTTAVNWSNCDAWCRFKRSYPSASFWRSLFWSVPTDEMGPSRINFKMLVKLLFSDHRANSKLKADCELVASAERSTQTRWRRLRDVNRHLCTAFFKYAPLRSRIKCVSRKVGRPARSGARRQRRLPSLSRRVNDRPTEEAGCKMRNWKATFQNTARSVRLDWRTAESSGNPNMIVACLRCCKAVRCYGHARVLNWIKQKLPSAPFTSSPWMSLKNWCCMRDFQRGPREEGGSGHWRSQSKPRHRSAWLPVQNQD